MWEAESLFWLGSPKYMFMLYDWQIYGALALAALIKDF
jgi:hypothetical protein